MYGIDHVAIYANNADALRAWYADTFKFEIVHDVFLKTASGMIEVIPAHQDGGMPDETASGIRHFALNCDEFEATVDLLKKKGVQILREPTTRATSKVFFFRDPEDNIVQLIQWTD